jgi:hypothetical protein
VFIGFAAGARGGAKEGKIRWSSNPQIANRRPPLKVPAADKTGPGKVELRIVFKGRERAIFSVIGDGDTTLDLVIKDAKGRIVAEDVGPATRGSDLCLCRWTPDEEQEYTIVIYNHGKVYNLCQAGCN